MSWGTLNVDEQRARFIARLATGSLPASPRRHFLIANLELKPELRPIRINELKFSNRKFSAVFHPQPRRPCPKRPRVSPEASGAHLAPPFCSTVTRHSSPVTAFLIETPRLEIRVTSRKQNQSQFLIETNQALSPSPRRPSPASRNPCLAP
jgi:hypothetical protein